MSESNRVNLIFNEETVFNEVPATPLSAEVRFTSEGLGHNKETVEDEEIRDDRQVVDLAEVGVSADGDISMQLSYGNGDKLLGGALASTFGAFSGVTVDLDALQVVAASNKIVRATGSWVTDGFTVNQWVRTRGFSTAANNGLFQVSVVTATDLTLINGTGTLVDEASATARTVQGLFGTTCVAGVNISTTATTVVRASGSFVTDGFRVGQRVRLIGFTAGDVGNNAIVQITAVTALALTIAGVTLTVVAPGTGRAIFGDHMRDGTTKRSFQVEKQFKDISKFISYRGMRVSKVAFSVASRSIMKLVYSLMGTKGVSASSTIAGAITPANANKLYVAGANVASAKEGGVALTQAVKELSWEVDNGLAGVETVTSKEYLDIALGTAKIKGKAQLYFSDLTHYDKFQNHTVSSLEMQLQDVDSNVYYIQFPTTKYSNFRPNAAGKNQQILVDAEFQALHNDTYSCQMMIDRIPV